MSRFFIDRPIFAWVLAVLVMLLGIIALRTLPVAQFPSIAAPSVSISTSYPGADAQTLENTTTQVIEQQMKGIDNLRYFSSTSDSAGNLAITLTFEQGTDADIAQVQVQNKLSQGTPLLPQEVQRAGLRVAKSSADFLVILALYSEDGRNDQIDVGDLIVSNMQDPISRIPGVGDTQLLGASYAMRIWLDPYKMTNLGVTVPDIIAAVQAQNAQVSAGQVGSLPTPEGQALNATVTAQSRLRTAEEFQNIVVRATNNGAVVRLEDVARVELGADSYNFLAKLNGHPAAALGVKLAPGANALDTVEAVKAEVETLTKQLPLGVKLSYPVDNSTFITLSVEQVVHTLIEAIVLVFVVMFVFLQNWRATLIPTIAVPVVLLGTFAILLAAGYTINTLTLFGMVLAIGLLVDDAIVVVENVERIMSEEGLPPLEATRKAMGQISGAIIGVTVVLIAVFVPLAFFAGAVGNIYRQFSMVMAVSIAFSAFLALSLTPALCATLLKPVEGGHHEKKGFFGWFNRGFERLTARYSSTTTALVRRAGRMMLAWLAIGVALAFAFGRLPSAFLPEEDQGYFMTSFQLPGDATVERTLEVVKAYEAHVASRPGLGDNEAILGFGFSGSGPNAAMAFTMLKDWDQREGATAQGEVAAAQEAMNASREGMIMSLMPPAIDGLGNSSGFALRLQDRSNQGQAALMAAQDKLLALAAQSPVVAGVYPEGLPPGVSVRLDIDRAKAQVLGVAFADISDTLSAAMGSVYVNDFPNAGRMQQVIVQAEASARMQVADVLELNVRNVNGGMVPLAEVVKPVWTEAPPQLIRYLGYPSVRISGAAAPGASSGEAMEEMERLASQLGPGFAVEWTGQSLQERETAAQAPLLMALSMLVVFLVLAALYESWSIPFSVMLVVPLGLIGAVAAVMLRGLPNDVFFKVGMITVIGLSAKNAILIVEFARQLHDEGKGLLESAVEAARLRLRPILMTSLAFALGVVPLMLASGASAETQHAIGTGVFGGMVAATVLAVLFVPAFFVFVVGLQERIARWRKRKP